MFADWAISKQTREMNKETETGTEPAFREGESAFGLVEVRGRNGSSSRLIGRQYEGMVLIEQNQFGEKQLQELPAIPMVYHNMSGRPNGAVNI